MSLERLPADITEEQFIEAAEGADAAIVAFNQITPYVLDRLPSLKLSANMASVSTISICTLRKSATSG